MNRCQVDVSVDTWPFVHLSARHAVGSASLEERPGERLDLIALARRASRLDRLLHDRRGAEPRGTLVLEYCVPSGMPSPALSWLLAFVRAQDAAERLRKRASREAPRPAVQEGKWMARIDAVRSKLVQLQVQSLMGTCYTRREAVHCLRARTTTHPFARPAADMSNEDIDAARHEIHRECRAVLADAQVDDDAVIFPQVVRRGVGPLNIQDDVTMITRVRQLVLARLREHGAPAAASDASELSAAERAAIGLTGDRVRDVLAFARAVGCDALETAAVAYIRRECRHDAAAMADADGQPADGKASFSVRWEDDAAAAVEAARDTSLNSSFGTATVNASSILHYGPASHSTSRVVESAESFIARARARKSAPLARAPPNTTSPSYGSLNEH